MVVISGKDRGKEGAVLQTLASEGAVVVEGVNVVKKHQKPRLRGQQGQVIEKPMPIDASNVAIKDPKSGKPARVGYVFEGEGEKRTKVRVARPSGEKL